MKTILVVDDSRAVRLSVAEMLNDLLPEASIVDASDVQGAVNAYARSRPALVLLDLVLPGGESPAGRITRDHRYLPDETRPGGLLVLERILAVDPRAMVVVVTGLGRDDPVVVAALSAGAAGLLPKPVTPAGLSAALAGLELAEDPERVVPPRADAKQASRSGRSAHGGRP